MSQPLPPRPNLEWLKKRAKDRLTELRAHSPLARLSEAQLDVAREYGFPSWRKLKAHVEQLRDRDDRAGTGHTNDPDLERLLTAAESGEIETVAEILDRRPELANARGPDGKTPFHAAAWSNVPQLAVLLLAAGADPEAKYGESGHTALSWAITCNSLAFAKTLVLMGHTPDLFCAAGMGALDAVRACFDDAGALLPVAARTGSSRLAPDGRRLPCPPETAVEQISDALYIACRNAHENVVRFLLSKRPDLSFKAYMGGTPLHWAYFGGSRGVIGMLEQAGADRTLRDDVLYCTPRAFGICVPANWGIPDQVRERLAEDPSLANFMDGRTSALHEAARAGHASIVAMLLAAGGDPRNRNGDGETAIEVASKNGQLAILDLLQR